MKISIIIPVFNEQDNILIVLERLENIKLPDFITDKEMIIVDDCSNDKSFEVINKDIESKKGIKLIRHCVNQGKGAAIRTGLKYVTGDVIIFQDGDLELSPDDIPRLLEAMQKFNVEFVNGSRYLPGVIRPVASYMRYLANKLFTFLTSLIINVKLTDMACGYKLIHKRLLDQLDLKENRFGFEAELIIKALKIKRNNIIEVPVHYFPRLESEGKKLKNIDALKILWVIIKYSIFSRKKR